MANKEVSFGCRYIHNGIRYTVDDSNYTLRREWANYHLYIGALCNCPIDIVKQYNDFSSQWVVEIIWHPVMIWDVIAYLRKDYDTFVEWKPEWDTRHYWNGKYYKALLDKIIYTWELFRKPIEDQSEECIDYVYSLIQKD